MSTDDLILHIFKKSMYGILSSAAGCVEGSGDQGRH